MQSEFEVLAMAAVMIACLHTLAGPDHYLPFIALSKARSWSFAQTLGWTVVCGCGHVWSSVVLGLVGASIGWSLSEVKWLESVRGGLAGWALLTFGLVYIIWGLLKLKQNSRHKHFDIYDDGSMYVYEHKDGETVNQRERHRVTPWVMFVIFVLGPCEPMIPLLYYPAARHSIWGMIFLICIYTVVTLAVMILMVVAGYFGNAFFKMERLERYNHVIGGLTIFICGGGMVFMGW